MKYAILLFAVVFHVEATTIAIPAEAYRTSDVVGDFEKKCFTGKLTAECQIMSSALRVQLLSMLPLLSDSSHPENIALFKSIGTLSDPALKEMSFAFLQRSERPEAKEGLIESAVKAIFGDDSYLVNSAMDVLDGSEDVEFKKIADYYKKNTDTRVYDYEGNQEQISFKEWWYENNSFLNQYHHPEQERFMGFDLPLVETYSPDGRSFRAAKAYFVKQKLPAMITHFSKVTGTKPLKSLSEIQARMRVLEVEMAEITRQMQSGNYSQVNRLRVIMEEVQGYSDIIMKIGQLGVSEHQMEGMTAFLISSVENEEEVGGGILLKEWPTLQGTSIMYIQKFPESEIE